MQVRAVAGVIESAIHRGDRSHPSGELQHCGGRRMAS